MTRLPYEQTMRLSNNQHSSRIAFNRLQLAISTNYDKEIYASVGDNHN